MVSSIGLPSSWHILDIYLTLLWLLSKIFYPLIVILLLEKFDGEGFLAVVAIESVSKASSYWLSFDSVGLSLVGIFKQLVYYLSRSLKGTLIMLVSSGYVSLKPNGESRLLLLLCIFYVSLPFYYHYALSNERLE